MEDSTPVHETGRKATKVGGQNSLQSLSYAKLDQRNSQNGAYIHGVLMNACNILVVYGCVRTDIFLHNRGSFSSVNLCPVFVAFLEPEVWSAVNWLAAYCAFAIITKPSPPFPV